MTISSTTRTAGPFTGNGLTSVFPFAFKVFLASDLSVISTDTATGVDTTLALIADYTVALNASQEVNPGGSITLTAGGLAAGLTLVITSDMPNLQPTAITNQGGFYPNVINDALDRAIILIQQLQVDVDSALKQVAIRSCAVTVAGTVYTAPGVVCAAFVNGVLQSSSAYTALGAVITLNYTADPGDVVDALCTKY